MSIQLIHSVAYRQLKKKMGQANHFLITILIGLDEVGKGKIQKPETLDVSWNPKNVKITASRSREFALNSSLAWVIDNFDSYVQNCKRKPTLIENKELSKDIDSADRSVNDKFKVLFSKYKNIEEVKLNGALLALGIQWRNNTTHSEANNVLDKEYAQILLDNKEWYYENFCHLNMSSTLNSFNSHKTPSLKETTSIIRAVLRFVELVDSELIKVLVLERYIRDLFDCHFSSNATKSDIQDQRFLLKTLTKQRQISRIKNILLSRGFTETTEQVGFEIDQAFISKYFGSYYK